MTFGSLFAGFGGMDLGLEKSGMVCDWQVEINTYALKVLAKHWPNVRRHDDIRTFPPDGDWSVDLIAGGFPCQDVSLAGKGAGLDGDRSGLWFEFARVIRELRPRFVLVENTPGLFVRGFNRVLGDLATLGYDTEWESVPAAAFGARHLRERVFIIGRSRAVYDSDSLAPWAISEREREAFRGRLSMHRGGSSVAGGPWADQPGICRVVNGVSDRVVRNQRRRGIGNAVVPVQAEWIGRRIIEANQQALTPQDTK